MHDFIATCSFWKIHLLKKPFEMDDGHRMEILETHWAYFPILSFVIQKFASVLKWWICWSWYIRIGWLSNMNEATIAHPEVLSCLQVTNTSILLGPKKLLQWRGKKYIEKGILIIDRWVVEQLDICTLNIRISFWFFIAWFDASIFEFGVVVFVVFILFIHSICDDGTFFIKINYF